MQASSEVSECQGHLDRLAKTFDIGTCNKILEATPSSFAGWDRMIDEQLLDGLKT